MKLFLSTILLFQIFSSFNYPQRYNVIESNNEQVKIEINFENTYRIVDTLINGVKAQLIRGPEFYARNVGEPWLPVFNFSVGIPHSSQPTITDNITAKISYDEKFIIPFPDQDPEFEAYDITIADKQIYSTNNFFPQVPSEIVSDHIFRYARILNIQVSPFQFNPVSRQLIFNKKLTATLKFNVKSSYVNNPVNDGFTESILKTTVINFNEAINWLEKSTDQAESLLETGDWYDPLKTYYKIYLKEKGVYRITYDLLESQSVPIQGIAANKLQIFSQGEEAPLYILDQNGNGIFETGDYFEFVGYELPPSPYSGLNIYNLTNLVWFSYEADSSGLRYMSKDGYPNFWVNSFATVPNTLHYEADTLYEKLGHAVNDQRDYWFWGKTSGTNGTLTTGFGVSFPAPKNLSLNATNLTIYVNMYGITFNNCNPDHHVKIYLTSQLIGEHYWDGYSSTTFQSSIDLTQIGIFATNNFQVSAFGDLPICPGSTSTVDEIRVNWFEIEYPMDLKADNDNITFKSPPSADSTTRFHVYNWLEDNMKIFVPDHNAMIVNPFITNDQYHSVFFIDNVNERTEYFCVAENNFLLPDSIIKDRIVSDLRNLNNGADYFIITHQNFRSAADVLANFRTLNFPDTAIQNARIQVVDIEDIYDEFGYGLQDPLVIKDFIKFAFEEWTQPSPAYVALFGDMSYDYRHIFTDSQPNFIPSMPYHSPIFGQAASDNLFVTVVGNDAIPDLAIGRLSCETFEESNLLVNKIINYPDDNSKKWKQNVLLISSGQNLSDEQQFGFNDSNLFLDNNFIRPYGYSSTKVFRFPSKPEHEPFQGGTPEIRDGFNDGAVMANYYGHGGGYQWDLVFTNDDIYELDNGGRLPFITSVTCLTAHFDDQNSFGEQFNKVIGKGCIAFLGSSGLTFWGAGKTLNNYMFDEVFRNYSSIAGKFIIASKLRSGASGTVQNNLTTLLGDPLLKICLPYKPDFELLSSDISINPRTPVVDQNVEIKVRLKNYGRDFPGDSVVVMLLANAPDTSYTIDTTKLANFNEYDSLIVNWIPDRGGLYTLTVRINEIEVIPEEDHLDNEASITFAVFDLGEPSIIEPSNGLVSQEGQVKFVFIDIGYYVFRNVTYLIEIDTSNSFTNPFFRSPYLIPQEGLLEWQSPTLNEDKYFWRARIIVEDDSTIWNEPKVFSVEQNFSKPGYYINEKLLKSLDLYNVNYNDSINSLILNTNSLPPRPTIDTFEEFFEIELPPDIGGLSTITSDGTYIYFAHIAYYNTNSGGLTKIYKLGTGYNGTVKWQLYGHIPNVEVSIWHQMFYSPDNEGGHIYIATGDAYTLLRIDVLTGDTSRVTIPDGMINSTDGLVHNGAFYVVSDGRYVYNISYLDENGNHKYKVRTFDPMNNWQKVGIDLIPSGSSFPIFRYFFVAKGYLYPYQNLWGAGWMRKINLNNGIFEEEFLNYFPHQSYYAWTYDWVNDKVYASVYDPHNTTLAPKFAQYIGSYQDSKGSVTSHRVGPAAWWNSMEFNVDDEGSSGTYHVYLNGYNKITRLWDTLFVDPPDTLNINSVDANLYPLLQVRFSLTDTSFGATEPIKIKSIGIDYQTPAELMIIRDDITFDPDTILQGFNTHLSAKVMNIGKVPADSVKLDYVLRSPFTSREDSVIISRTVAIPETGSIDLFDTLTTNRTIFDNFVSVIIDYPGNEFFTFNNISENDFYVARDSVRPLFKLTFDGIEIINGDIVSTEPEVIISLEDNSPLPIDTSFFTMVHTYNNNTRIIRFADPDIEYTYTEYPESRFEIKWLPELEDGSHTLEILAKDASGNFFDSTSSRTNFSVYSEADLREVYNYPNPFAGETHFTFELRGSELPEELSIKIYTVAGRLIRDISIPQSGLNVGFNKFRWDGKDQDGDEIGNGLYLYKMIAKFKDDPKVVTQKLAKVK